MDPQQELFTAIYEKLMVRFGEQAYDALPMDNDAPYPFICMGEGYQVDIATKTAVHGTVRQTIHVWAQSHQRGTASAMMLDVKRIVRQIEHTRNFVWLVEGMEQQVLTDTSTGQALIHDVVDVMMKFG